MELLGQGEGGGKILSTGSLGSCFMIPKTCNSWIYGYRYPLTSAGSSVKSRNPWFLMSHQENTVNDLIEIHPGYDRGSASSLGRIHGTSTKLGRSEPTKSEQNRTVRLVVNGPYTKQILIILCRYTTSQSPEISVESLILLKMLSECMQQGEK